MFKSKSILLLFGLEILALASFLWHQCVSVFLGWDKSRLPLNILLMFASIVFCSAGLYKLLWRAVGILSSKADRQPSELFAAFVRAITPILFLPLIFLQHVIFLNDIRGYLLPIAIAGSAVLILALLSRLQRACPDSVLFPKIFNRLDPNHISPKRLARNVFLISLSINLLYASGLIVPAQPFTGDEPHYLLTAESLLKDGDINVYNNYRDKDYSAFYPGELESHAFPGKKGDDHLYSKHFFALSVMIAPSYALGKKVVQWNASWSNNPESKRRILVFFARLPLCLSTALLGWLLFLLVLDLTDKHGLAVFIWAVFSFTSPLLFFSHLLYPEIPLGLISLFVFRCCVFKKEPGLSELLISGAGLGLMPWFGVKYLPLSALVFGAVIFTMLSGGKTQDLWRKAVFLFLPIAVSAGLYLLFFWVIYGNFSPVSVYTGVDPGIPLSAYSIKFLRFPLFIVLERSLGYLIDQKNGILIYSPLYLLGFAGCFFYFKRRKRGGAGLLAVLAGYWVFSANYYWGGFCPPGRPLIPVLWIWGLFLAAALVEKHTPFRKAVLSTALALSSWVAWAALRDPWLLYHEQFASELGGDFLYSKFTRALSNSFVQFHALFPSLKETGALNLWTVVAWTAVLCAVITIYVKEKEPSKPRPLSLKMVGLPYLVLLLSLIFLTYSFFDIHLEDKEIYPQQDYALYFQDDNTFGKEIEGFWVKGKQHAHLILETNQPLSEISVTLTSPVEGTTSIQVGPYKRKVTRTKNTGFSRNITFSAIKGFPLGGFTLYTISIEDSSGFIPFQQDCRVKDNRY
ncbi:MAG: hypothetical protein JXB23_05090, partial [Candidatus Aminicenantes bacterium]|nr:hypothetical protein [Candidatus Aminicenantes bacterium]